MPFVTKLTLRSGDRSALDRSVEELRRAAERKGVQLKGPHTPPPRSYRVPQYRDLERGSRRFPAWEYTVYERGLELSGHDEAVRRLASREFPVSVHVEVEVAQIRSAGAGTQ